MIRNEEYKLRCLGSLMVTIANPYFLDLYKHGIIEVVRTGYKV